MASNFALMTSNKPRQRDLQACSQAVADLGDAMMTAGEIEKIKQEAFEKGAQSVMNPKRPSIHVFVECIRCKGKGKKEGDIKKPPRIENNVMIQETTCHACFGSGDAPVKMSMREFLRHIKVELDGRNIASGNLKWKDTVE